jgi:hypothetical protein
VRDFNILFGEEVGDVDKKCGPLGFVFEERGMNKHTHARDTGRSMYRTQL